jgi:hypothetical protein
MHVHVGNAHGQTMRDFAFDVQTGLVHPGRLEIMRKRGNVGPLELRQARRQLAIRGIRRTAHQRVGILGKYLVIKEVVVLRNRKFPASPLSL